MANSRSMKTTLEEQVFNKHDQTFCPVTPEVKKQQWLFNNLRQNNSRCSSINKTKRYCWLTYDGGEEGYVLDGYLDNASVDCPLVTNHQLVAAPSALDELLFLF